MAKRSIPSVGALRQVLLYNADTGDLYWNPRDRSWFKTDRDCSAWNTRYAGRAAFLSLDDKGYRQGTVFGQRRLAHRIIWALQTGEWPPMIDHENGDKTDNRWKNLRSVNAMENQQNAKRSASNSSGRTGVSWASREQKWKAEIKNARKTFHLGHFESFEAACAAREAAEIKFGFHRNHGRS